MWNDKWTICAHCRKVFEKRYFNERYCSKKCHEEHVLVKKENMVNVEKARYKIFERDEFRCVYCGKSSIEDNISLCIDHVEPYSVKMNSNVYNLVTACYQCNFGKGPYSMRKEIYERVIAENKRRTDNKISRDSQSFVNSVLKWFFDETKNDIK
jgi:hypothetical protein